MPMGLLNTRCIRVKPAFAGLIFFKVCHHRIRTLFAKFSHQLSFWYPIPGISTDHALLSASLNVNFRFTPIFVTREPLLKEHAKLFPITLYRQTIERFSHVRTQRWHIMIRDMAKIQFDVNVATFINGGILWLQMYWFLKVLSIYHCVSFLEPRHRFCGVRWLLPTRLWFHRGPF